MFQQTLHFSTSLRAKLWLDRNLNQLIKANSKCVYQNFTIKSKLLISEDRNELNELFNDS
ncbi:CLUMA_CG013540, isoform A [Clunio marinus]|uniref:CLUMA_CG013540, isoform A n=1 Tax=Clunio marinus TaxID=568069 RepID=A0A1J1IJ66_9DIPT|nr:CLUMA_CG013540, isoform A [Clunio marinus]